MRYLFQTSMFVVLVALVVEPVIAQQLYVYPTKGQGPEQQNRDRYECHSWAVQQTGYDPTRMQSAGAPPPQEASQGGLFRGAARGAAVGAVGGAIGGNTGRGALIGAAAGGIFGGLRSNNRQKQNQQSRQNWERQQSAQYQQGRNNYNRAFSACMSGRGYTIS